MHLLANLTGNEPLLVNLPGNIEPPVVGNMGWAWVGVCPGTAITARGLGAVDALTADRTRCGAPKPLLLQGQLDD